MLCKRGISRHAVSVRPCVCLSGTFVDCVKTNKHIFKICSLLGSQAILVFSYQTAWQYSDENTVTGASNAGGVSRNRDSEPISVWLHCVLLTLRPTRRYQHDASGPRSLKLGHLSLVISGGVC